MVSLFFFGPVACLIDVMALPFIPSSSMPSPIDLLLSSPVDMFDRTASPSSRWQSPSVAENITTVVRDSGDVDLPLLIRSSHGNAANNEAETISRSASGSSNSHHRQSRIAIASPQPDWTNTHQLLAEQSKREELHYSPQYFSIFPLSPKLDQTIAAFASTAPMTDARVDPFSYPMPDGDALTAGGGRAAMAQPKLSSTSTPKKQKPSSSLASSQKRLSSAFSNSGSPQTDSLKGDPFTCGKRLPTTSSTSSSKNKQKKNASTGWYSSSYTWGDGRMSPLLPLNHDSSSGGGGGRGSFSVKTDDAGKSSAAPADADDTVASPYFTMDSTATVSEDDSGAVDKDGASGAAGLKSVDLSQREDSDDYGGAFSSDAFASAAPVVAVHRGESDNLKTDVSLLASLTLSSEIHGFPQYQSLSSPLSALSPTRQHRADKRPFSAVGQRSFASASTSESLTTDAAQCAVPRPPPSPWASAVPASNSVSNSAARRSDTNVSSTTAATKTATKVSTSAAAGVSPHLLSMDSPNHLASMSSAAVHVSIPSLPFRPVVTIKDDRVVSDDAAKGQNLNRAPTQTATVSSSSNIPPASILVLRRVFDTVSPHPRQLRQTRRVISCGERRADWTAPPTDYTGTLADIADDADESEGEEGTDYEAKVRADVGKKEESGMEKQAVECGGDVAADEAFTSPLSSASSSVNTTPRAASKRGGVESPIAQAKRSNKASAGGQNPYSISNSEELWYSGIIIDEVEKIHRRRDNSKQSITPLSPVGAPLYSTWIRPSSAPLTPTPDLRPDS